MRTLHRREAAAALLALPALALGRPAAAQNSRPVRVVVPAAPGGAIDVIGRIYATRLSEKTGSPWVTENRSGANNTVGAAEVARSAPDGKTLLINADIQLMAKRVMRAVPYDPITDFTPVARLATAPLVLVGNPAGTPNGDLGALVAAMKAAPDKFAFANSALGSMGHLSTESFKRRAGLDTLVVSYRGTAPALTDVLAGQTALMVAPLGSALPHLRADRLRAFAVFSPNRSAQAPEIPTTAEAGMPDLQFTLWYGLWGPKGMPAEVVNALNAAVREVGAEPAIRARLTEQGADPVDEDAAGFARFIGTEAERNGRVAQEAGIEPE
ncbi:Bug family tripartite tricarboxylate transporter substrate binding protein [Roseomonas sp. BN140053]|uniref:Bug family tripartite tricarboxylate transporter substrate binding protein n=1 Tax=Roseomonas sp. BN140053 TaxID=3391898 RepID=UPI0039E9B167